MSLTFPTLDSEPIYYAWTEGLYSDPTLASAAEQGCILSRLRATVQYKRWHVEYRGVSGTDKLTVETFQTSVGVGADKFYYTCPTDSTEYLVRLTGPMQFRLDPSDNSLWQIDFDIYGEQAIDSGTTEYYSELAILVPQLGAGVDDSDRPILACPDTATVKSIGILYNGAPADIDDDNTAVITIKNGAGDTIGSITYDTTNQPTTNGYDSIDGSLSESLAAGEVWTADITQGATANLAEMYFITTLYVGA